MDVSKLQYTEEEMDEMGEAMLLAHEVQQDEKVHALVKKHLKKKGVMIDEISSRHADTEREEMAEEDEKPKKSKPVTSIKELRKRIAGED